MFRADFQPEESGACGSVREISRRLAHPGGLTDADARRLAAEGKPFIHIDGGLHASEVAGPQMMPQLAYDLLSRTDDPEIAAILDNVIFMLWPTINPDGQTMVAEWFMSHVGTPEATALPRLYQEYVGHDNNRDAYMLDMIESRVMEHTWREWEPSVVYVQHQSPPFPARIFVPPFAEPIAVHAPPVISQEINAMGMAIAKRLDEHGLTGTIHGSGYDAWYPGYIDYMPTFKNIPAFWTETAGNGAVPREYTLSDIPANMREPKTLYSESVDGRMVEARRRGEDDETAAMAVLDFAAKQEALLFDRYLSGREQIANGRRQAPARALVPEAQRDPVAAVELLRRLAFSGVAVSQLRRRRPSAASPIPRARGLPADQGLPPSRAKCSRSRAPGRQGPPTSPIEQPYDAAGWTPPLQMGVQVVTATAPLGDDVRSKMRALEHLPTRVSRARIPGTRDGRVAIRQRAGSGFRRQSGCRGHPPARAGRIRGAGPALAVNPAENNAFRAVNRALRAGLDVQFAAGTRAGQSGRHHRLERGGSGRDGQVSGAGCGANRGTGAGRQRARLALYDVPTSIDQGWTRWVLDQHGFRTQSSTGRTPVGIPSRLRCPHSHG